MPKSEDQSDEQRPQARLCLMTDATTPNSVETFSAFSSSASTPAPPEPFEPLYNVRFTNQVTKDGDVVLYTIKVVPTDGSFEEHVIQRQYEDLEWLEHCLTTARNINGIIVPPLPPKPTITTQMAEAKSRRHLGDSTHTLMGDEFYKDCRAMEKYLNLVLVHSHFGQDPQLEKFLTKPEPPTRALVRKGLFSRIADKMENRKSAHRDCDEFFQKERDWVAEYGDCLKSTSENFNKMVYGQQRLCIALGHLSTALNLGIGTNEGYSGVIHRLLARWSEGLTDFKCGLEVQNFNDDCILGSTLELYSRYVESEKDMLFRRTCLLVDYENSNRNMDKAKGNKYETPKRSKPRNCSSI